jgi:mycothiol synthase
LPSSLKSGTEESFYDQRVQVEIIRTAGADDVERLKLLFDDVREHDHHEALGEHKWLDLVHGGRELFAGVIASEKGHAHPVGYAHVSRHPRPDQAQWGLEVVVHPEHRGVGVEVELVSRALELVKEGGGGHVHWWVFQPSEIHDGIAHRLNLTKGRDLLHMRIDLPVAEKPVLPSSVRIRAFEAGRDEQAWLDLNNEAFQHHPEQGAWDMETLERRMREEWFDAADLLLAEDDTGLAGSNWTKLDHERKVGEIYVIAVDPRHQGSGLGRALSLAGLEHMAGRGMRTGTLYVDASNEAALGMYRRIGFDIHHTDRAYVTDIAP